jgi:hypothetical protein
MPINLAYTVDAAASGLSAVHLASFNNRVQSLFQRLGWEHVSQSQFRYPSNNSTNISFISFMNRIVPGLSLFRYYSIRNRIHFSSFTIDATIHVHHNSNGPNTPGSLPLQDDPKKYVRSNRHSGVTNLQFGYKNLCEFLSHCQTHFPY